MFTFSHWPILTATRSEKNTPARSSGRKKSPQNSIQFMSFSQYIGDSKTHAIPLVTDDGAAFTPGTDWTLIFTAKLDKLADADTEAAFQKASGAGITVTGSTASVRVLPEDTKDLTAATLYIDIQAQHLTTGEVKTVALDKIKLIRDVTRQTTVSRTIYTEEAYVARGAKGDKGDKGDQGNPGNDAAVTNANVVTAVAAGPAAVRSALKINTLDASVYGASPSGAAAANVAGIQAALDAVNSQGGGVVAITAPGTYDVNGTMRIYSNTTLFHGPGVTIRKTGSFGIVYANDGAWTGNTDVNIKLIGLRLLVNNVSVLQEITTGLRAHISFFRIQNLEFRDFEILDPTHHLSAIQFAVQIVSFEDVIVADGRIVGNKDGLHFGPGKRFRVSRYYADTYDDGLALNAHDWLSSNPSFGDITDGVIDQYVTEGKGVRMMTGSWLPWQSGNQYIRGDATVSAGKIYRSYTAGGGGLRTASVAPAHTSGTVTGADGIAWRFERVGTETETCIRRITFRNCRATGDFIYSDAGNEPVDNRRVYPGTYGASFSEHIRFLDCAFDHETNLAVIQGTGRFRDLAFVRCKFGPAITAILGFIHDSVPGWNGSYECRVLWDSCEFQTSTLALLNSPRLFSEDMWVHTVRNCRASDSDGLVSMAGEIEYNDSFLTTPTEVAGLLPRPGGRSLLTGKVGLHTYRYGLWQPDEASVSSSFVRTIFPLHGSAGGVNEAGGTSAAVSVVDGGTVRVNAGNAATGYALCRLSSFVNWPIGSGTSFSSQVVISGSFTGIASNSGVVRLLVGPTTSLQNAYPADLVARYAAPFTTKGFGFEMQNNGGVQQIRVIAYNASAATPSAWVSLGTPANRQYLFRLHSNGAGKVDLYVAAYVSGNAKAPPLPETPSASIATGGPTGNSGSDEQGIWAIAQADGTTNVAFACYATFDALRLEWPS
jgi:hypothetical protein